MLGQAFISSPCVGVGLMILDDPSADVSGESEKPFRQSLAGRRLWRGQPTVVRHGRVKGIVVPTRLLAAWLGPESAARFLRETEWRQAVRGDGDPGPAGLGPGLDPAHDDADDDLGLDTRTFTSR